MSYDPKCKICVNTWSFFTGDNIQRDIRGWNSIGLEETQNVSTWNVSKYGVSSGPYFSVFGKFGIFP